MVAGTQRGHAVFAEAAGWKWNWWARPIVRSGGGPRQAPRVPPAEFGAAESLRVGRLVVAVGNPPREGSFPPKVCSGCFSPTPSASR
ncbi:hypothetical protein ACLH0K_11270 [Arthrobacter sp. MPF02]|uniref:hypothetical protein n=1 Tax=Arthrobacter sp. MPF02 TaxID=3388492 RepID=UPI0039855B41